jgi:hypothetical protein
MSSNSANYWELARLLDQAAVVIDSLEELNLYCPFDTPADFSSRVRELAARIRREDHGALRELLPIFAPTGAWDDAIGLAGVDLANRVDALLDRLRGNAEPVIPPDPPRD